MLAPGSGAATPCPRNTAERLETIKVLTTGLQSGRSFPLGDCQLTKVPGPPWAQHHCAAFKGTVSFPAPNSDLLPPITAGVAGTAGHPTYVLAPAPLSWFPGKTPGCLHPWIQGKRGRTRFQHEQAMRVKNIKVRKFIFLTDHSGEGAACRQLRGLGSTPSNRDPGSASPWGAAAW